MQLKNLSKATQINDFLFWKERDHFAIYFNEKSISYPLWRDHQELM